MQCMMKEICAQCLQRHRNLLTGTETVVFSCFNQDQEMDRVDFRTLRRRLSQNGVQEKLTKLWVDRCLQHLGKRPALAAEGIKLKRRIFFFRREELSGSSEFGLRAVDSRHVASKAKTSRIVLASKSRITLSHRRICRDAR